MSGPAAASPSRCSASQSHMSPLTLQEVREAVRKAEHELINVIIHSCLCAICAVNKDPDDPNME